MLKGPCGAAPRFAILYANWAIVLSEDADVCPDGSILGDVDTCVNYTGRYSSPGSPRCYGGTMEFPCACVDGYTPYATKYYLWKLSRTYSARSLDLTARGVTGTTSDAVSGGDGSSSQCGTRGHANVLGAALVALGTLGCMAA